MSTHPLCLKDAAALAATCTAWRRGRSGAAVLADWLALAPGSTAPALAGCADARALLLTQQLGLEAAFELEVETASPSSFLLADAVYATPTPTSPSRLRRMSSLRAELDPLAAAATAEGLVTAVAALGWPAVPAATAYDWRLLHERRGHAPGRLPSPQLVAAVSAAMRVAEQPPAEGPDLRFVVLETDRGFLFSLLTCSPAGCPMTDVVWARKPHNYSAGLPFSLARLAVNLATGLQPVGCAVVDPCAGSGTILVAAIAAGAAAVGGVDIQPTLLRQIQANLAYSAAAGEARAGLRASAAAEAHTRCAEAAADAAMAPAASVSLHSTDSGMLYFSVEQGAVCMSETASDAAPVAAFVSNLPYGRMVGVAGAAATAPCARHSLEQMAALLAWLRPQARRHAYFASEPIAPLLLALGFHDVREVSVDVTGRRFLALASGWREER